VVSSPSLLVLSHIQTELLLAARRAGRPGATTSPDLGLTQVEVSLDAEGVVFPEGRRLTWAEVEEIDEARNTCFVVRDDGLRAIQTFSSVTNRFLSLMPTALAPTLLVAGFPMHRIKDTDPYHDTREKIRAAKPIVGQVLDTATGLGYTAIEASRTADHVTTIELDPAVLDLARLNPWSQQLFDNPKITQLIGDSFELIAGMEDDSFSRILHDPPTVSLAGDLYSGEFYRQLFRVLAPGGRLFHYLGDPASGLGRRTTGGAVRRLQQAGFTQIRPVPRAYGVVAHKPPQPSPRPR
jgi:predicted methyltransferase